MTLMGKMSVKKRNELNGSMGVVIVVRVKIEVSEYKHYEVMLAKRVASVKCLMSLICGIGFK